MGGESGWNPNRERERFSISRYLKRGLWHDGSDRKIELLNGIIYKSFDVPWRVLVHFGKTSDFS